MEVVFKSGYTKDGYLSNQSGRIILYEDYALVSNGPSMDHNNLLRAFASRFRFPKDEIISNAVRLYYTKVNGTMVVSECRQIDYDMFQARFKANLDLIRRQLKR
jgi:hypothetical protein